MTRLSVAALVALLLLVFSGTSHARSDDLNRVAIIGDSLTTGYGVPPGAGYADWIEARTPGDNVLPVAVHGATALRWLVEYPQQLEPIRAWQPRTVLIALGGNEYFIARSPADYAQHLRELTNRVRQLAPTARIIYLHYYEIGVRDPTVCDVAGYCQPASPPPSWFAYGVAMRDVAAGYYIDNAEERAWSAYLRPDRHLTAYGHWLFAQSVANLMLRCC